MTCHRRVMALAVIAASLSPLPAKSGTDAAGDSTARTFGSLTVRTDLDSAVVVLDGERMGITPLHLDSVATGVHILRVFHPDITNWLTGSVTDSVRLGPGEHVVRAYSIAGDFSVNSNPAGAEVFIRDSLLGYTPLLLPRDTSIGRSVLTISKAGYASSLLQPQAIGRGFVSVSLAPAWPGESMENREIALRPEPSRTGLYLSGATAVVAGIATAYFKIQADERQDRYAISGDPALLSQRDRLDRSAAITYVITQVGFGIFAYLLLSD